MSLARIPPEAATTAATLPAREPLDLSFTLPPEFRFLWVSGLLWNLTRWLSIFTCTYFINRETGSPILVQLVGSTVWAPMFFGGALGGVIADRFDRRRTTLFQYALLAPVAFTMAALMLSGAVHTWMVYPYILLIGVGGLLDATARRTLILDVVGHGALTKALAYESLGGVVGNLGGTLTAGALISTAGFGSVFLLIGACHLLALFSLSRVNVAPRARAGAQSVAKVLADIHEGYRYVKSNRALVSILGVTVIFNVFYFSFTPLVPVFADHLHVNALLTGVLASAISVGSISANMLFTRRVPFGRGMMYTGGTFVALAFLLVFAAAPWYPLALVALFFAGTGNGGFGTMQSVLVMATAEQRMAGRSMGLLSMAIGTGPFAMLLLGIAAQVVGPREAVITSATIGLLALVFWARTRPESQKIV